MEQKTANNSINLQVKNGYDSSKFIHHGEIKISEETQQLLEQAQKHYSENFDGKTWYGRCIFISWFCSLADCTFCFRSTNAHKGKHPSDSRRSMGSILLEALFCRIFNWKIEFITGGYGIMPFPDLLEIIKNVSIVYGDKTWLNLGVLPQSRIDEVSPYVEGIFSSLETLTPKLHDYVCPSKPIKPFDDMFSNLGPNMKKAIAVIVGLGDTIEDMKYLFDFIEKHNINRVTMYALKPVFGTEYTHGPEVDYYLQWLARLRIKFPKLEIVAGTNLRRCEEVEYLIKAGANAITKFPATKQFGTKKAFLIRDQIVDQRRDFISNITELPDLDWDQEIDSLEIKEEYKLEMKDKIGSYLKTFRNPKDKDKSYTNNQNKSEN